MQAQSLKSLHLNAVMHDIAQRADLAHTAQRLLGNLDSTHYAEAEARIIINRNAHISHL
jgi:hypothetical protein